MTGSGAVHVTTQRRHYTGMDGQERVYETHLLRRSWREDGISASRPTGRQSIPATPCIGFNTSGHGRKAVRWPGNRPG
jgi:hypothetical protein